MTQPTPGIKATPPITASVPLLLLAQVCRAWNERRVLVPKQDKFYKEIAFEEFFRFYFFFITSNTKNNS